MQFRWRQDDTPQWVLEYVGRTVVKPIAKLPIQSEPFLGNDFSPYPKVAAGGGPNPALGDRLRVWSWCIGCSGGDLIMQAVCPDESNQIEYVRVCRANPYRCDPASTTAAKSKWHILEVPHET